MCVGLGAGVKAFSAGAFGQWGGLASIASLFMKKPKLPKPVIPPIEQPLNKLPDPFKKKELKQEPVQVETAPEDRLTMLPEDKPETPGDLAVAVGPGVTSAFDAPIGGRTGPVGTKKTTQNIGISSGTGP